MCVHVYNYHVFMYIMFTYMFQSTRLSVCSRVGAWCCMCVMEQVHAFDEFCDLIDNTHTLAQGDEEQEKAHSASAANCPKTAQKEAKERVAQWLLELAVTVLKEISQRIQQELILHRYDGTFYRRFSEAFAECFAEQLLEPICSRVCSEADKLGVSKDVAKDVAKDLGCQRSGQTKSGCSQCDTQMSAKTLDNFFVNRILKVKLWRDAHLGLFAALQRRAQILMAEVSSCSCSSCSSCSSSSPCSFCSCCCY